MNLPEKIYIYIRILIIIYNSKKLEIVFQRNKIITSNHMAKNILYRH